MVGFIDDNPGKSELVVRGVKVLGDGGKLAATVRKHRVHRVLIAIPSASGEQMTRILRRCQEAGVPYKTVPGLGEIIKANNLSKQIREVAVEDLLGRNPARLDEEEISGKLDGKVVLVTGAGGSIGSELCRQIARFRPKAIVGYEISENALFHLNLEMKALFPEGAFSSGNWQRPEERNGWPKCWIIIDRRFCTMPLPFHKHVPMMEAHMFEALENNVFGTYTTARAAAEYGVEDFVMVSTDQAVRPTSIMGVSKRLAELAVNSLQNGGTRFISVRFGNVLGSNGSVVPLFKKQIAAGGPITVTHPEMQRYFMTIPEASQLVLQASTMGRGGEVFVLDMGEPVKITELARNLILLSGLRPDVDIRIEFTGIRPGEKNSTRNCIHSKNRRCQRAMRSQGFHGAALPLWWNVSASLRGYAKFAPVRDVGQLILQLKEIVPEYNPSSHVLQRALEQYPPEQKTVASTGGSGRSGDHCMAPK